MTNANIKVIVIARGLKLVIIPFRTLILVSGVLFLTNQFLDSK